jgi:hypothetical protein
MVNEIATITRASATLATLSEELTAAASIPELDVLQRKADAFRHMLDVAKFDLIWQNRFAALRFRSHRRIGQILKTMAKNEGGDPLKVEKGSPTLKELGLTYNFSSDCQKIADMPEKVFEEYLAKGEGPLADDQAERRTSSGNIVCGGFELTKRGLLDAAWGVKSAVMNANWKAREVKEATEQAIKDAAAPAPEPRPRTEPPPKQDLPPPPPPTEVKVNKVKAVLRTATDAMARGNEVEALNAVRAAARIGGTRLESLDDDSGSRADALKEYAELIRKSSNQGAERMLEFYNQILRLETELEKLRKRDRDRLAVIQSLRERCDVKEVIKELLITSEPKALATEIIDIALDETDDQTRMDFIGTLFDEICEYYRIENPRSATQDAA